MQSDGCAGFEGLYRTGRIAEVAWMTHGRRRFVDVHKAQGAAIAEGVIKWIADFCAIEQAIRRAPPDVRTQAC